MAKPDNEITVIRAAVTSLLNNANADVNRALTLAEGQGATDAERVAFYNQFFSTAPDYDIDSDDFFDGIVKLRELRTWLATPANYVPLAKLRI